MLNIKQRQMNLKFLNFYHKNIDGIEGTGTREAYKEFQRAYNLVVDGIYGVKTNGKLIETIKYVQGKIGAKQDGIAGNETKNKCKEYQKKRGLVADGICGEKTRAKLNELTWENIQYFKEAEFTCKCGCGANNIDLKLVEILDNIREHFGQACIVTSGTRCMKHNKNVGGVSNSRHLSGKAADIKINGVSGEDLLKYANILRNQGKIRYTYRMNNSNAIHIDIN